MYLPYKIKINGYEPPPVAESGYSITPNRIWSSNTGRSATGKMHGDIIATKYTLKCTWAKTKQANVTNLSKAVRGNGFFPVTFYDERGELREDVYFYCADVTYNLKKVTKNDTIYENLTIELIEQ